jgi:ABC-type glycerol-3-phosphate transport system substrate-binding protein
VLLVKKVLFLSLAIILSLSIFAMANVVTITLYGSEHLQVAVNLYEETHPNVKINLVDLPYSDYMQKIGLAMVEGKQYFPNVFQLTTAYVPMIKSYLINLAPYIQNSLNMTPEQYKDSIYSSMSTFMGNKSQIISVPLAMSVGCMWINKIMWEKAGILPPPLNGQTKPWTWDQFISAVKKVKEANHLSYGLSLQKSADKFYQFISEYGVTELNAKGQYVFNKYQDAPALIDQFVGLFRDKLIPSGEWLATENPDQDFFGGVTSA